MPFETNSRCQQEEVTFQLLFFDGLDVAQWQAPAGAETLFEKNCCKQNNSPIWFAILDRL
jgi:hypothetical protein